MISLMGFDNYSSDVVNRLSVVIRCSTENTCNPGADEINN